MALTIPGQYGPVSLKDSEQQPVLGVTVDVPDGYTATVDGYHLTIVGPPADEVEITTTTTGGTVTTFTIPVGAAVAELEEIADLARDAVSTADLEVERLRQDTTYGAGLPAADPEIDWALLRLVDKDAAIKQFAWTTSEEIVARALSWLIVTDYGATLDGAADDTTAAQEALTAAGASGGTVYFPAGTCGITAPLVVPAFVKVAGAGVSALYPNFTTDWQTAVASWGHRPSTIQYLTGHGALFDAADNTEFAGLVLRCPSVRTSDDMVFSGSFSHGRFTRNVVQNMYGLISDNSASWGALLIAENQFSGCTTVCYGIMVDCKVLGNSFTSTTGKAFDLTSGAGLNLFTGGNRFEFGEDAAIRFNVGSRENMVTGNLFDAHLGPAIICQATTDTNTILGNLFWRNGRGMTGDYLDCHILLNACSGQRIEANTFKYGGPDGGGGAWSGPMAVIGLESCINLTNTFKGNRTRHGAKTSRLMVDRYSTSTRALLIDGVDLPAGAAPGGASDDIATALSTLAAVLASTVTVDIRENRQVNSFVSVAGVILRGIGAAITLTNSSGNLANLAGADNVTYGGRAYSMRGGHIYASAQPDQWRGNGGWPVGTRVYNSDPAAGGTEGWVIVTAGSPDVWKTFGSIAA